MSRLSNYMKKYIVNTIWLISDKLFSILGSLVVTILVARYLGPENMGMINYAIVLASFIVPFSQLGCDNVIFDRSIKNNNSAICLIKATLNIRVLIYILFASVVLLFETFFLKMTKTQLLIDAIIILAYFFLSIDIYKPYYDGRMKSKINSLCGLLGLVLCLILRTILIKYDASAVYFSLPYLMMYFFPFCVKNYFFSSRNEKILILDKNKRKYILATFKIGFPMLLSSLSIVFYTRFNQILLSNSFGEQALAQYNAALTLTLGWVFIPIALGTSLLTKALSKKKYRAERIGFIFLVMYSVSIPILFIYYFFSKDIINLTYGNEYIDAAGLLPIMVFGGLFSAIGTITSRVIISYSGYNFLMKKTIVIAIMNIVLGMYFVPKFGLFAIAYIQLITEFFSSVLSNFLFKKISILKCYINVLNFNEIVNKFKLNE